mmetsp:Transcript_77617/g.199860  ORF Transcript_77617/g.199860 Transcript_77617/m.199860 type:complete len:95 (+) Transcript_77617:1-285(+)
MECLIRSGLAYGEVGRIKGDLYFGMVQGDDEPIQCHSRNLTSPMIPPPPGDPAKNPYTTLTYMMRKESHFKGNGLCFQFFHRKEAERLLYEGQE